MKTYKPLFEELDPRKIIPHHELNSSNVGLFIDYYRGNYVPPVPVIRAPRELEPIGKYINYNGHHRTDAGLKVMDLRETFRLPCLLIESDKDLKYLFNNPPRFKGEIYPEVLESLGLDFEKHKEYVIDQAKKYLKIRKIKKEKSL